MGGQALPTHIASGKRWRTFPSQTNPVRTGPATEIPPQVPSQTRANAEPLPSIPALAHIFTLNLSWEL